MLSWAEGAVQIACVRGKFGPQFLKGYMSKPSSLPEGASTPRTSHKRKMPGHEKLPRTSNVTMKGCHYSSRTVLVYPKRRVTFGSVATRLHVQGFQSCTTPCTAPCNLPHFTLQTVPRTMHQLMGTVAHPLHSPESHSK